MPQLNKPEVIRGFVLPKCSMDAVDDGWCPPETKPEAPIVKATDDKFDFSEEDSEMPRPA